jgi:tetratricopeptide (TPR) repeat protein
LGSPPAEYPKKWCLIEIMMPDDPDQNNTPKRAIQFRAVLPGFPDATPITGAEYEALTKAKFEKSGGTDLTALYNLSTFYSQTGRLEDAEACVVQLLASKKDSGHVAVHMLQLGQIAERRDNYELAVKHYQRGLEAGPTMKFTQYVSEVKHFLVDNLSASLFSLSAPHI